MGREAKAEDPMAEGEGVHQAGDITGDTTVQGKLMKISEFIESIGGLAENTKLNYKRTLWQLQMDIDDEEPTDEEIYAFLKRYPANSLQRHKAAIKAYLEYREPERRWPFTRRTFAQRRRHIPVYIPPEWVPKIAEAGDRDDYMFVWSTFQLGCRISELMDIHKDDIMPAGVKVITKGGWARVLRCTKEFKDELLKYARGKKGRIFPHSYNYYKKALERLGKAAGYPNRVNPHMLRHARAVDLLNKGMPEAYVQQLLGHKSPDTTRIYLEITGGELAEHLERIESGEEAIEAILRRLSPRQLDKLREVLMEKEDLAVVA